MKVLFMAWDIYDDTNTLPQFFQCCTGGSLVIKNICEYVGRKCESYLFIGKNKVPEMDLGNIHIIGTNMIPETQDSSNETYLQTMATAFSDTLEKIKPDIVNIHGIGELAKQCIELCIAKGVPYVYTDHLYIGLNQHISGYERHIEWEKKLYSINNLKIIVVSTGMKKKILNDFPNIPEKNISVVLNGTNFIAQKMDNNLKELYSISSEKVLLCVGTLLARKNQVQIVDAFRLLPPQLQQKIKILFCGLDRMEGYLQDRITHYGLQDRLIYCGKSNNNDIKKYYSIADGLIVPSKAEGLSIAMLEAITYGLPIIMFSDSECADDLNDKKVVCFSVDRSDQSLANAIIEWFENDWDHNYIVQYSKCFSMENVAMNYIDYYKRHISTEI